MSPAAATQLAQATGDLPKMILVGIEYDVKSISDTGQIRVRDFSPTCSDEYVKRTSLPKHLCGGADRLIDFIQDELSPFVAASYRADMEDSTLLVYSFGGSFALHVLFSRTDLFDRYVIGSQNIGYDNERLFGAELTYAEQNKDLGQTVYLSAGKLEGFGTIRRMFKMHERLLPRDYPGLSIKIELLDDETHMAAINSTAMGGFRFVMSR